MNISYLFSFKGRVARKEYLTFVLCNIALGFVTMMLTDVSDFFWIMYGLIAIAQLVASTSFLVRRLRDTGYSLWWILLMLVPLANLWLLIVVLFFKSKPKPDWEPADLAYV